jgi:hypothetical protein
MKRRWLKDAPWTVVAEINRQLCAQKHAQHDQTSDGYGAARQLWDARHGQSLSLSELAELCHACHRHAPFLNFNGNTFVAIARQAVATLGLPPPQAASLRSLIGHIVAGTAEPLEHGQFLKLVRELDDDSA